MSTGYPLGESESISLKDRDELEIQRRCFLSLPIPERPMTNKYQNEAQSVSEINFVNVREWATFQGF